MSGPGARRGGGSRRSAAARPPRRPRRGEVAPDPARLAEGWTPRFAAEGRRAEEAIRLYRDLGFEVAADPIGQEQLAPDCGDCRIVTMLRFRMIYTRRPDRRGAAARGAPPGGGTGDA